MQGQYLGLIIITMIQNQLKNKILILMILIKAVGKDNIAKRQFIRVITYFSNKGTDQYRVKYFTFLILSLLVIDFFCLGNLGITTRMQKN